MSAILGSIPSELGNLTSLTTLYLYNNNLSGNSYRVTELADLTILYVCAVLSGSIPSELGNLTSLLGLFLSDNSLSGKTHFALVYDTMMYTCMYVMFYL